MRVNIKNMQACYGTWAIHPATGACMFLVLTRMPMHGFSCFENSF